MILSLQIFQTWMILFEISFFKKVMLSGFNFGAWNSTVTNAIKCFFIFLFNYCVCEYACVCVCSCTLMKLFSEGLNRGSRTLDLDLLLVISPLMWVVGTKVRSSKKTVNIVDCWAPAHFYYKQTKYNSLAKWLSHTHYEGNDGGTDLGK